MSQEKIQEVEEIVSLMMDSTIKSLKRDLSTIHAGRVSPSMLDSVKVDYYGTPTPINQVASISTPEPQLLAISPWEKNIIKEVERSLQAANLGFSISNDGNIIRAVTPPFTEERRKDYVSRLRKLEKIRKLQYEMQDVKAMNSLSNWKKINSFPKTRKKWHRNRFRKLPINILA